MSTQYLMSSIEALGTSSAGLLLRSSSEPSSLSPSSEPGLSGEVVRAFFQGTVNVPGQELQFWAESAGPVAVKRLLGCILVIAMPEAGVEEALTTLKEVYEFRSQERFFALPTSEARRRMVGKALRGSERPELVISD